MEFDSTNTEPKLAELIHRTEIQLIVIARGKVIYEMDWMDITDPDLGTLHRSLLSTYTPASGFQIRHRLRSIAESNLSYPAQPSMFEE